MPRFVALAGATILVLAMSQPAVAQSPSFGDDAAAPAAQPAGFDHESETGLWIVTLEDASLAAYTGDIPGFAATSPSVTGAEGLDVDAPASVAYRNHLATAQRAFIDAMEDSLGRSVPVVHQYLNVLNGLAVEVSVADAAQLAALPGVTSIVPDTLQELDTDVSHTLIGTASFWDGKTGPDLATRGEGVVVGVIDGGVNPSHPSFAAVSPGDGYVHENPFGSGNFVGACDPASPNHQPVCNDKLIGAYNFDTTGLNFPTVVDLDSHGSHTSSTAAGNLHEATFTIGQTELTRTIQGVAPRANIVSYKVCDVHVPGEEPECPTTATVAAVDQTIADGVDVINMSLGGDRIDSPWASAVDRALLDATGAGIFAAASAANSGPSPGIIAHTGPWEASVAASTHQRIFAQTVDVAGAPDLQVLPAVAGTGPPMSADIAAEIRFVAGNPTGCTAFPAGAFTGSIALIERGPSGCTFATKEANARAAGAIAVVIFNNRGGPPEVAGGLENAQLPLVMIEQDTGQAVRDRILDNAPTPTQATINLATQALLDPEWADVMAGFSSVGPSRHEVLAPTFTAPGVNVLAAAHAEEGAAPAQYTLLSGTSMSSPHAAGSGALLASLHPDWSPAQIRSALAGTADPEGVLQPDAVTPANQFNMGSGRLDLAAAARVGLTLDETAVNFAAANPATGGDPKTLNVPSFIDHDCGVCSWERTLTSVADAPASYTAVVDAADGMTVTVSPSEFTVPAGGTVDIEVTVDATGLPEGEWAFADVRLETSGGHAGGEPIASVHYPIGVIAAEPAAAPAITVDPDSLSAEQAEGEVTEQALTIGNTGGAPLEWSVFADEPQPPTATGRSPETTEPRAPAGSASLATQWRLLGGTFGPRPPTVVTPEAIPAQEGEITITHSASQDIVALNSVACSPDGGLSTNENGYVRHFVLPDFAITSEFAVSEVSFAIENLTVSTTATVNLFTMVNPAGPFTYANFQQIGTADAALAAQSATLVDVPVTGTAPAGSTLVVEVDVPDMSGTGAFFIGSNSAGQTAPSYLRSASCGLTEPADLTAVGFPGMHIVMNVTGTADVAQPVCDGPGEVPWLSVSPESGTTAGGGSSEVTISFDSTGLAIGEYTAVLCVTSNDPATPLVRVPVTLTVVEDGGGEPVVCDETITSTHSGALTVEEGVTCLAAGSRVLGEINVLEGAGLVATAAVVQGPISALAATVVEVVFSQVTGPVLISGATGSVSLFANQVTGSVSLLAADAPSTVSGNTIIGSLSCSGNQPLPTDHGLPNTATGGKLGQCADL